MQKYIVLKDLSKRAEGLPHFNEVTPGPMGFPMGVPSTLPPQPQLEVRELDTKDVKEVLRERDTIGVAPPFTTKLIEPMPANGADGDAQPAAATNVWGVEAVGADRSPFNGKDVSVAVLDTGIDKNHAAFTGVATEEKDFSGSGNGDVNGHGTHCAGTIFGRDVNGKRIGVARGVKRALIGKVLNDNGGGSSEMLFNGLNWAVEQGADVVSMSLGFDFPGYVDRLVSQGYPADLATSWALDGYRSNIRVFDRLMDMFRARAAFGRGVIVVAASGNDSRRDVDPDYEVGASVPAAANGIISVGALKKSGNALDIAYFSNTNPTISAPGVNILSAKVGGGLKSLNGTSMACPHVAGVAALWWEKVLSSPVTGVADTVKAKIVANARTDVFAPATDIPDRGVGISSAPLN